MFTPTNRSDAADRIAAVLPFLISKARSWHRRLPDRARVQLDVDDALQELWAELLTKDRHFNPARGAFITFAAVVADRKLQRLGDQLCRGPRRKPLDADLSDPGAGTPIDSIERSEARQQAATAIDEALARLDDRHYFVVTAIHGIGRESMTVPQLAAWLVASPSRVLAIRAEAERELRSMLAS